MKTRIVSAALIEKEGKILMGNKAPGRGPYPNTWRLPGGGVEEGETLEQALIREVKEEVGLDVIESEKILSFEDKTAGNEEMIHFVFNIFKVRTKGKEASSEEFPTIKWVDKNDLNKTNLAKPSTVLFKFLGYL